MPVAFFAVLVLLMLVVDKLPLVKKRLAPTSPTRPITRNWVKNMLTDDDSPIERQMLRDAIQVAYVSKKYWEAQAQVYGWSERFVASLVQTRMPAGLENSNTVLSLERASSRLAGCPIPAGTYTHWELRECLYAWGTKDKRFNARMIA